MYRLTTPTHTFTLPFDPAQCSKIVVTYEQGEVTLEKEKTDMTIDSVAKTVSYQLTQDETKIFRPNKNVAIQMRVKQNGTVMASPIYSVSVSDVLNEEVI